MYNFNEMYVFVGVPARSKKVNLDDVMAACEKAKHLQETEQKLTEEFAELRREYIEKHEALRCEYEHKLSDKLDEINEVRKQMI